MKNIPNKIFLNIGYEPEKGDDFNDLGEVTWCVDKVNDSDIEYQRKPIWYDLRKNPKDLPNNRDKVIVKAEYDKGEYCYGIGDGYTMARYGFNQEEQKSEWTFYINNYFKEVLAWMEIPKFK